MDQTIIASILPIDRTIYTNRWYDRYERLAICIGGLKFLSSNQRDQVVQGLMALAKEKLSGLLDRFVLDFPLDINRRRWYDNDPYLWLVINGLRYADSELREQVTCYLEQALTSIIQHQEKNISC